MNTEENPYQIPEWKMTVAEKEYTWSGNMDRVMIIRNGMPYEALEIVSDKVNLPIKKLLDLLNLPQTTYNKRKREKELMDARDTEIVLLISELLDYGISVFNRESDKFKKWLNHPNISLGGMIPLNLLDSISGIEIVRGCLDRIEYGNFA